MAYLEIKNYQNLSWDNLTTASRANASGASSGSILSQAKEKLAGSSISQVVKAVEGIETRGIKDGVLKVQYNPASIKFTGKTQKDSDKTQVEEQKQEIATISAWGVLTMAVDLVFYSTSSDDASVLEQMTALLKMMQKSSTKEVIFSWANTVIEGKVTYFTGEYQMFYPSGLPKAGKISLKIEAEAEPKKIERKIESMVEEKSEKLAETEKA